MFPQVFWIVWKVSCTSCSLETSQLSAVWSTRAQIQTVCEHGGLHFIFRYSLRRKPGTHWLYCIPAKFKMCACNNFNNFMLTALLRENKARQNTSSVWLVPLPPGREATAARAASSFLETTATLQPLCASRRDTAFPMPLEPPHTTASLDMSTLQGRWHSLNNTAVHYQNKNKLQCVHIVQKCTKYEAKHVIIHHIFCLTTMWSQETTSLSCSAAFGQFKCIYY